MSAGGFEALNIAHDLARTAQRPISYPHRVELAAYDQPRYRVLAEAERPPAGAEIALTDLDIIRTDLEPFYGRGDVWSPVNAGDVIPAAVAGLPRRPCTHRPACPHFGRLGHVLVQVTRPLGQQW